MRATQGHAALALRVIDIARATATDYTRAQPATKDQSCPFS
ncbi:MAG: hypothetical protein ACNA7O_12150 [Rhodobacterales bacterium]